MVTCCVLDYNLKIKYNISVEYDKIQTVKDSLELGDTICVLEDIDFIDYIHYKVSEYNNKMKYVYDIIFNEDKSFKRLCDEYTKYLLQKYKYKTVIFIPLLTNSDIKETVIGNVNINDNTLTLISNNKCTVDLRQFITHEVKSLKLLSKSDLDFTIDGINIEKDTNIIFKKQPNLKIDINSLKDTQLYGFTLLVDGKEMYI